MKLPSHPQSPRGMSLIELTVIMFVLLTLVTVLFVGARAWKRGSDRAGCILNIRTVQAAVRSHENLALTPVVNLQSEIIGNDKYFEVIPDCPANGTYTFVNGGPPAPGNLAMTCSLSGNERHTPESFSGW